VPLATDGNWCTLARAAARGQQGVASPVFIALTSVTLVLFLALMQGVELVSQRQQLNRLAETIALAASDARRGLVAQIPCELAEFLALSNGARLQTCRIVNDGIIIALTKQHLLFEFESVAYAGAP
jgi:hypothetical protein